MMRIEVMRMCTLSLSVSRTVSSSRSRERGPARRRRSTHASGERKTKNGAETERVLVVGLLPPN